MKSLSSIVVLAVVLPLTACGQGSAEPDSNKSTTLVGSEISDVNVEAPLYDSDTHDAIVAGNPKYTYGKGATVLAISHEISIEEFYATNPSWKKLENEQMPDGGTLLGYNLPPSAVRLD